MNEQMLAKIEEERQKALNESNSAFDSIQNDNQALYDFQNNNLSQQEQIQNGILDKQLANNVQKIEQQKETARKNKEIEEKKARNDYAAFINPYGYQNENLAQRGLLNSGVSETSQLGGFNAYQNRLASANKVMQDAIIQYDNDINDARLNNDVLKAQNALTRLQSQIEFAQTYYTNKSNNTQNRLTYNQNINSDYFNRYQTELDRQEQIRQYNESLAFQKQQAAQDQANLEKEYNLQYGLDEDSDLSNNNSSSDTFSKVANILNNVGGILTASANSNKNNLSTEVIQTYSPKLSYKDQVWYSKNIEGKEFTRDRLQNALNSAYVSGEISKDGVFRIASSFGLYK